ncbi:Uma2 family endonuclease [Psychrobacter sp. I-STPA10]|uniref:Uma2 family endonuclease n=1 Tax=Psychrobacter sp. I-STPA10 TaxID=2585769 RepID=UPI001E314C20|nr:Uma2 family endonuclease [Psychrobacter sp. I-STPA10]
MKTLILTFISLIFSGVILKLLVDNDAKRLRAYRLKSPQPWVQRYRRRLWGLVALPCIILLLCNNFTALTLWLIGICMLGWMLAARPPQH